MTTPVALWVSCTQLLVLLTAWPPLPLPFMNFSSSSDSARGGYLLLLERCLLKGNKLGWMEQTMIRLNHTLRWFFNQRERVAKVADSADKCKDPLCTCLVWNIVSRHVLHDLATDSMFGAKIKGFRFFKYQNSMIFKPTKVHQHYSCGMPFDIALNGQKGGIHIWISISIYSKCITTQMLHWYRK